MSFTTAKLSSEAGKKVEYLVTVKNTGNTTLKFSVLKDAKCVGVSPAGETTLKAGESETFSCEHMLAEGDENPYKNSASISGGGVEKTSNTVEVEIKKPNFTVIKEQRLKGEAGLHDRETESRSGADRGIQDHGHEHGEHDPEIRSAERREMHELLAGARSVRTRPGGSEDRTRANTCSSKADGPIYTNVATDRKAAKKKKKRRRSKSKSKKPTNSKSRRNSGSLVKLSFTTAKLVF